MALLQYTLGVTGEENVERALRSVEKRYELHGRRIAKAYGYASGAGATAAKRAGAPSARNEAAAVAREQQRQLNYWHKARAGAELQRQREQEKTHRQRMRQIDAEKRAEVTAAKTAQRQREQARGEFRRNVRGTIGRSTQSVRAIGSAAMTTVGLGGGLVFGNAIRNEVKERGLASQLANQVGRPGIKGQLLTEARGVKGFTGEETLSAMEGFVTKTGDLDAARASIQSLSQLALATGTDFGEMGEAAGQAFNVIRDTIKDPKQQMAALNDVMRTFAAQGALGAVEIKDMATEVAGLGAATRKFKGGPAELLKTMGAMAQAAVARGGASSAAEATTAVTRFAADITKQPGQKALRAAGVNVFADKGKTQLKAPEQIMLDILDKTKGDMTKVEGILNAESAKALAGFSPLYLEAEKKKKGSGRQAVLDEFSKFTGATLTDGQIKERADSRLSDEDMQIKESFKQLNIVVGKELVPALTRLLPEFTKLIPLFGQAAGELSRFISWFASNPWTGVGLIVGGAIVKDIASAKIGDLIANLIAGKKGGAGAGAGGAGIGGAGAAAGAAVVASGLILGDQANKLQAATGAKHSLTELLPGVGTKGFDSDQLLSDVFDPIAAVKRRGTVLASVADGVVNMDENFNAQARARAAQEQAAAKAPAGAVAAPDLSGMTGAAAGAAGELVKLQSQLVAANAELAKLSVGAGLNRGNAPSVPVVK